MAYKGPITQYLPDDPYEMGVPPDPGASGPGLIAELAAAESSPVPSPGPASGFPQAPPPPNWPTAPPRPVAPVRPAVDLMGAAQQRAQQHRQRGALAGLVDALVTGGANRQDLSQTAEQRAAEEMALGQQAQRREDLSVAGAQRRHDLSQRQAAKDALARDKAAAAAREADPNSPENQRFQQALLQTYPQLNPAVARGITLARWKQHRALLDPAMRAQTTAAGESAKEASAGAFHEDRVKRAVDKALKTQRALEPGKRRIAAAGAARIGIRELAKEERAEQRQIAREERAETRRSEQEIKKEAREYGKALIQSGIADQMTSLSQARKAVKAARADDGEIFSIADMAAFKAGQFGLIQDRKARRVAESFQRIMNITLKDRSGAAVSNAEFERLRNELGAGLFATESDMLSAMDRMEEIASEHRLSQMAGFSSEAIDLYEQRGKTARKRMSGGSERTGRVRVRHPDGRTGTIDASKLEAAKKKGFEEV